MSKKLIIAFLALAFVAGSAFAVPAKADWDHHHNIIYRDVGHHRYRGYWHNGVFINLGLADVPVAYAPAYAPAYVPPPAYYPPQPAYYYPPAPVYYPPAYYPGYYPTAYFMGMPVTGIGLGLNFRIR